jgi:hypothetical protein
MEIIPVEGAKSNPEPSKIFIEFSIQLDIKGDGVNTCRSSY